jgi:hypothetical protein
MPLDPSAIPAAPQPGVKPLNPKFGRVVQGVMVYTYDELKQMCEDGRIVVAYRYPLPPSSHPALPLSHPDMTCTLTLALTSPEHFDRGGLYDMTDFTGHPGGVGRLQMAAGGDLEVYWRVYTQHNRGHITSDVMAPYKIGQVTTSQ